MIKLKNSKIKFCICIMLVVSMIGLAVLHIRSVSALTLISASENKLSASLIKKMSKMDKEDTIPVTVFLKELDDSNMNAVLINKFGKDPEIYENETRFYNEIVPNIMVKGKSIKSLVDTDKLSPAMLKSENRTAKLTKTMQDEIKLEITKEMNEYIRDLRSVRLEMNTKYMNDFTNNFDSKCIVFSSKYIEMLIMELSKTQIIEFSNNSMVDSIYYYEIEDGGVESWNAPQVVEGDSSSGLSSANFNNGEGYDGTGVKIGIIEHDGGRYDENNYSLADAHNTGKLSFVPTPGVAEAQVSNHATTVTSIICGKKITIDGKTYEGLAPGATVIQTAIYNSSEFYSAMEHLISQDVNIINFSARLSSSLDYTAYDKAVDKYIHEEKISFVKSAGNNSGYVTSPGKAYNAITVGNLQTKSSNNGLSFPYNLSASSSFREQNYLANKPDVVAPGTDIYIPISSTSVKYMGSGTSYAAPVVTGVAAQLMTEETIYLLNPNALKNIIICGAHGDLVSDTTVSYGKLMDKSGAGLISAVNSLEAKGNEWFEAILYTYPDTEYRTVEDIYLRKGETIRIVLTYHKEEDFIVTEEYGNNLDIRLAQTAGFITHAISESTNNNVEVIEFKATSSGTYNLQVRLAESILDSEKNSDLHYCITWRIF